MPSEISDGYPYLQKQNTNYYLVIYHQRCITPTFQVSILMPSANARARGRTPPETCSNSN